jgi:hypothetical protein
MATTLDGINGWDEVVALGVARKMSIIANLPNPALNELYTEAWARIRQLAPLRVRDVPGTVRDVEDEVPRAALSEWGKPIPW